MSKEKFISFAVEYDDLVLYHALKEVKEGFYIDIGANDPWSYSVTKAFSLNGWKGINIEPLRDMYELLQTDRPNDINLCMGIGDKEGELPFLEGKTGSTFTKERMDKLNEKKKYNVRLVSVKTLTDVYEKYINQQQPIHFCKIDVEGFEKQVLLGIDFTKIRPWIFAVESLEVKNVGGGNKRVRINEQWETILFDNGYQFALHDGMNSYYYALEKKKCLENNILPASQLLNMYDCYKAVEIVDGMDPMERIMNSKAFKIGNIILKPFRKIKGS